MPDPRTWPRAAAPAFALASAFAGGTPFVDFEKGLDGGWFGVQGDDGFGGGTRLEAEGGNPRGCLHTVFHDFGVGCFDVSDPAWACDWTEATQVTVPIDLKVSSISFSGTDVSRPWVLELRGRDGDGMVDGLDSGMPLGTWTVG